MVDQEPKKRLIHISSGWLLIASGLLAAVALLAAILMNEYRLRSFVDYPWLQERDAIIERIEKLENAAP